MIYKIKSAHLKSEQEKSTITCPICKEAVYENLAMKGNVQYKLVASRWQCEHLCCDFFILGETLRTAEPNHQLSGHKYLAGLSVEPVDTKQEVLDFLKKMKADRAIVTHDPDNFKFYYFFFKSEGFGFIDDSTIRLYSHQSKKSISMSQ